MPNQNRFSQKQNLKANSPQEILDVVNEKDEVVGQLSRSEVHTQNLLHREIGVLIYDDQGRLLI